MLVASLETVLTDETTCYRHGDRTAAVSCQVCERPICTNCMTQASVGFHCPQCVKSSGQKVIRARDIGSTRPPVTVALIATNVLIHLVARSVVIDGTGLRVRGLLFGPLVQEGEWWRVVTAGFLHADFFHLGFNMFLLWILGQSLERSIGSVRFVLAYFAGLLGGSLAVTVFNFEIPGLGASGAVLGLAGAMVAILWSQGRSIKETPLGGLLVINLVLPLISPQISFWGHAGGAAFGFVAGWILAGLPRQAKVPENMATAMTGALCFVLFAACLFVPAALGY